jgi:carbon-monoxide dehydrogenase medium subunit
MNDFQFHRPTTLADAAAALSAAEEGKLLAGGQSLLPVMKLGLAAPTDLVCVRDLPELCGVRVTDTEVVVGAATTHAEVADSADIRGAIPALAALAETIGDPQVRNRGTLGGSIAHNDPAADYPAALVALNARVKTDRRELGAEAFFVGMFETALEDGEIICEVSFEIPTRAAYAKFPNPASRFAIVGVMAAQGPSGARVAVVGAGPGVFRVSALESALDAAWDPKSVDGVDLGGAIDVGDLVSDMHASAAYRAHLVGVMARRAVAAAS